MNRCDNKIDNNSGLLEFSPTLSEYYDKKLSKIISSISRSLKDGAGHTLLVEINKELINKKASSEKLDAIKYIVVLNLLKDLIVQGWDVQIHKKKCFLSSPSSGGDKSAIRKQLEQGKKAQFNISTIKDFIIRMEKSKTFNGQAFNIKALIGNKDILIEKINEYKANNTSLNIVEPYIQRVDGTRDIHTGYRLNDIWRYFRYTWSIPYKSTPGRNIFYLVRDSSQAFHPVIGIFALGNCVLNLNTRDNYLGWTVDAIKNKLHNELYRSKIDIKALLAMEYIDIKEKISIETLNYCEKTINSLNTYIDIALNEIRHSDLINNEELLNPQIETIKRLNDYVLELRDKQIDNRKTTGEIDWLEESNSILFTKKRALEVAKLLEAKIYLSKYNDLSPLIRLLRLLSGESGRKNIATALIANRKRKIGSNIMEIIVCGAIPPYNELLGGKLVSLLCCSPQVINDYEQRYHMQISEISSRMKGEAIVRDSSLAYLGTTSLYHMGSSQYNRIKIKTKNNFLLQYKELGMTEGYGSIYFSKDTTSNIAAMLEIIDNGRKISNVFGEGTSPKIRLIRRGLSMLEINIAQLLKHNTPRIVYGIELAQNTKEFLAGMDDELKYYYDKNNKQSIKESTNELIDIWKNKWLFNRMTNKEINIEQRLNSFMADEFLLSKLFN